MELAFVIPLVLLFLFGIIDFGLALNQQNSDTNLANLAARSLSVMGTTTTTQTCSQSSLLVWVDCVAKQEGEAQPTTACLTDASGGTYAAGDSLKVEIQTPFSWLALVGVVGSATSTISSSATNRIEQAMISSGTTNPLVSSSAC